MTETVRPSQRALASAALHRSAWFATCRPETIDRLLREGTVRLLQRGEALCRQGQPVEHLCLIVDGTLEISVTTEAGKRFLLRHLEPGQLMNLIPVLDEQGAIHDSVAHADTLVLLFDKALIQDVLDTEPGFARAVMRLLCLRSRTLYLDLSDNSLLTLRQRCARILLYLVGPWGMPRPEGVAISLKLSQDEFADMVGRSRPVVNRELKNLEREGIIRTTYSHFVILDLPGLERLVAQA
ncbi:CRP/FNR family cyclic AMP-dependent transcriptional regulator [Paraburkholderia sp. GAS199]|uniref:Crp/Fnr family transcriptional regulator n=1 Tax=Paraburkholderia sp. GAS199 TaxID=3035126 RepID=UPI003D1FE32B